MKLNVTRRDAIRVACGSALGLFLTPVPWKVTDDLAIWTQNWSWIPRPPKGRVTSAATVCSLCPAGCPVRVRCVGGAPVSVAAAAEGAAGRGLCPLGLTAHHLALHPSRLARAVRLMHDDASYRALPVQTEAVLAAVAAAGRRGRVAVLDQRPGRAASWAWRRLLAGLPDGTYVPAPGREGGSAATLRRMLAKPWGPIGLDLARAATVISFGAPPAGLSGTPAAGIARPRLVRVEPRQPLTARAADGWLPVWPGSEGALALGLANVLLAEALVDVGAARRAASDYDTYRAVVARFTPDVVAAVTGVAPGAITAMARELAARRPAIVFAGSDPGRGRLSRESEAAIWGLNALLGSLGGCVFARAELPDPDVESSGALAPETELDEVPDGSLAVLFLDAAAGDSALPWGIVKRKLSADGLVVGLSPYLAGSACNADYVLPTPAFLEGYGEVPTRAFAPAATLAVSAPLLRAPEGAVDPVAFLRGAAAALRVPPGSSWTGTEAAIQSRARAVFERGRGEVVPPGGRGAKPVADFASADAFWTALAQGARWRDSAGAATPAPPVSLVGSLGERPDALVEEGAKRKARIVEWPLLLLAIASTDVTASAAVSPVFGKLYRESGLRRGVGCAAVHPDTGSSLGLKPGCRAKLSTPAGWVAVVVAFDRAVMPGVVETPVAPTLRALGERDGRRVVDPLELCGTERGTTWGATPARLVEA